jgi:hypothetical protein
MTWLWKTVAGPILDSIDFAPYNLPTNARPRVFWVSTGWVPSFPIHAAGNFSAAVWDGRQSVIDRVVSSYIPSIRGIGTFEAMSRADRGIEFHFKQTDPHSWDADNTWGRGFEECGVRNTSC